MRSRTESKAIAVYPLTVAVLALLLAAPVRGQVAGATLSGTVTDASGAVIPQAQISIKNVATGVSSTVTANSDGFYSAPNLLPGAYEVTVSASGFTTGVRSGITLTVGSQQVLNLTLQVGRVTEKVQVAGQAPTVQLASSSVSAEVNSTTVRELPLNGRSWTDLATLQPGVSTLQIQPDLASGPDRGTRGFGDQITISGARPTQNNYRLDGVSINDYTNGAPGSVLGGNLGVDAVQEFSVLTSNYSAEYGRTSGGVVNAITRSGTNQFHGSAYEFLRNSALDARNFFDGSTIPPFRRNQFGAAAGGPIRKDSTFLFGDYEAIRSSKGVTVVDTVPSAAARAGNLSTGTVTVDPSVQKYLPLFPLPNGPILPPGDTGIFTFAQVQAVDENFFTTRADHRFSARDTLSGTYMYDDTSYNLPDTYNNVLVGNHTNRQVAVLEETHIFSPSLVNSIRAGFNREGAAANYGVKAINPLAADPSLSGSPLVGGDAAELFIGDITQPFAGGVKTIPSYTFGWNMFQVYDDAFLTRGSHSLKFGVALERDQLNLNQTGVLGGKFNFGSLRGFLTNKPTLYGGPLPNSVSNARGIRQTIFGLYVQDDWRWRPNLTLNLGLRYEIASVPTEVQNKLPNLYSVTDTTVHVGAPFFQNPTLRNFEPRAGFAWDPFHDGKTAVHGSFGIFDVLPLAYQYYFGILRSGPLYADGAAKKHLQGTFYADSYKLLSPRALRVHLVEEKPPRDYVGQWNLNVQREILPNLTAVIGYVGSRGVHQEFRINDMDIVMPTITPEGYLWPSPVASGTTINPNFAEVAANMYGGSSSYNALEVGVQKRLSHGIQFQTSFTWGKSIDTSSSAVVADGFANEIGSPLWFNPNAQRGLSDYNVARTLVINGTWQVPQPRSLSGAAAWLLNGWQLGAIYKASDGTPLTPTFGVSGGDPLGLNSNDPWDFPNRLVGPGCSSLVNPGNPNNYIKTQCFAIPQAPSAAFWNANCDTTTPFYGSGVPEPFPLCFNLRGNAGRNILIGPGTSNLDFSVFKNNYIPRISESFNVQFRAEVFNILNRANFAVPTNPTNTDIFDATGTPTGIAGLLTSTSTTSREIQFALKVIW